MAESMQGLKRSHRCAELSKVNIGETVTVMGWVQKNRNKGGIVFVDLRDRSGLLQLIFENGSVSEEDFEKAGKLRSEFVIAAVGTVEARSGAVNENLATGEIEIRVKELRILSESETPPFPIEENSKTKEELRLKYRVLDLRRPDLQRNLMMRSKAATLTRQFLAEEGFLEIETPMLIKSTPEGARDYLVPSRVHPGNFYALPQSPQIFKQLLMCAGYDRYFQIVKCFRDEDLRADRQPEFTQIDMELSFVDVDDVIDVNERLLAKMFKEILGIEVSLPIQRMTWQEAMDRFGSDKPDIRFGMELTDVSEVVKDCEFVVFKNALENGGSVRGINAKGQGAMPRKKIDKLVDLAKDFGAKGLAYVAIQEDGTIKSSFAKFMSEEKMAALVKAMDGENGDLLLFAAGAQEEKYAHSIYGVFKSCAEGGIPVRFVHGDYMESAWEEGLRVLYVPMSLSLSDEEQSRILEFAGMGGRVVLEAAAGLYSEMGEISAGGSSSPCPMLEAAFGAEEISLDAGDGEIPVLDKVGAVLCEGLYYRQTMKAARGKVTGWFEDGTPAMAEVEYGKGVIRWTGTFPGAAVKDAGSRAAAEFIQKQFKAEGYSLFSVLEAPELIVRLLQTENGPVMAVVNQTPESRPLFARERTGKEWGLEVPGYDGVLLILETGEQP